MELDEPAAVHCEVVQIVERILVNGGDSKLATSFRRNIGKGMQPELILT